MTAETSNARGEWPERYACNGPEGTFWTDDAALANKLIGAAFDRDEWTVTDTQNPTGAAPSSTAETSNARGDAEYEYEVWQGDALQAGGSTTDYASAQSEAGHYAMMYGQDGPVEVRIYEKRLLNAAPPLAAEGVQAGDGCHCGTCTCNPNMTPAVRFDLSPAQKEGAIREHLIRLGWTPPAGDAEAKTVPVPTRVHLIGETAVIVGTPQRGWDEDAQDAHNCDAMGCASIGPHVLARVPFTDERALTAAKQQEQAVAEDMGGFTSDTAALAFLHIIGNGSPNVERAVERLRQSLIAQSTQQGGGEVVAHGFYDPVTGAYSESQHTPRWLPAVVCTAPPSAPVEVDAPGSRSWMAEVCRAAALSLAAHGVRNDQLSKVADWIAQQPAPSAPVGVEDVDALAQEIRRVDGEHSLGASALAEALVPYLARTTLAQQPAAVYQCPRCATSMEVDPTAKPAAVGEEIMVNAAHDVFTLPLQPSGLSSGPRFVVHVPAPEQQPAAVDEAMVERAAAAVMSAPPGISVEAYVRIALEAALAAQQQEPKS